MSWVAYAALGSWRAQGLAERRGITDWTSWMGEPRNMGCILIIMKTQSLVPVVLAAKPPLTAPPLKFPRL